MQVPKINKIMICLYDLNTIIILTLTIEILYKKCMS